MHGIKFEVFKIIPEIRICGRISDHSRGFIKRREAGIFPFYSGMFPLLLLINCIESIGKYCQITRLLCLDTRMPKKLMKPLP